MTEHFLQGRFYQTSPLLVVAYAIMFFPLAVVAVRAAVARAPVGLEEVAGSLGVSRRSVMWRVTLPLVAPGLVAAFALVFLETATELTATLVLHPTNVETLTTQFWAYESNVSYYQAALYAGVMILVAAVPGYILGRWFDRQPTRMAAPRARAPSRRPAQWFPHEGPPRLGRGKGIRAPSRPARRGPGGAGGIVHGHPRLVGKRQDDVVADRGGLRTAGRRSGRDRGGARRRRGPSFHAERAAADRLRPPRGRTLPASERGPQRRLRSAPGPQRRERVDELLELVGLSGYRRRYPHQLSGGQQQRVALARALAIEPEVVLLDEPFSSLDAAMRSSVRADVHAVLRQAGTTSILVTHDQDEALSMADEVAVLRHGVVAQLDTPAALYGRPRDVELAQFLGESNVVPGKVHDGRGPTALGELAVAPHGWGPGGPAEVMVRPEQIRLDEGETAGLVGTVQSYEYYGHDAVVRVRPDGAVSRAWSYGFRGARPSSRGAGSGSRCSGPWWSGPGSRPTPKNPPE